MKTVIVLLNGIRSPFHVVDAAIEYFVINTCKLVVIILTAKKEEKPGYTIPSDLSLTENITDEKSAVNVDEKILSENNTYHEESW